MSCPCSASERSYYEVLGVSVNASQEEIKKAFCLLDKKYHPDTYRNTPSAKKKCQEIRDAYEVLQDPVKRAEYDRRCSGSRVNVEYGEGDPAGFAQGYAIDGFSDEFKTHFSSSFLKIFSVIFKDGINQHASDVQAELLLSFLEAAEGCTEVLYFDANVRCDSCGGVEGSKEVKVTIPPGVDSGDTIRVPEAGCFGGRRGQSGDLFIKLKVVENRVFTREGADVYVVSDISFTQAMLGGKVEVPTLSRKVQVKIPKVFQPGQLLILRGKGLTRHGFFADRGDQYARFRIHFPSEVNDRQRAILEEFTQEEINMEKDNSNEGNWLYQQLSTG